MLCFPDSDRVATFLMCPHTDRKGGSMNCGISIPPSVLPHNISQQTERTDCRGVLQRELFAEKWRDEIAIVADLRIW